MQKTTQIEIMGQNALTFATFAQNKHSDKSKKVRVVLTLLSFAIIIIGVAYYHAVDNSITEADKHSIPLYLAEIKPLPNNPSYEDELFFINAVQQTVQRVASGSLGIPLDQAREPLELYIAKSGSCYDRSRVIEKILRYSGFKTRHISMYSTQKTGSTLKSLLTPQTPSHALAEVLTRKGWLVVGSNNPWVSIDRNNKPISLQEMQVSIEKGISIPWKIDPQSKFYAEPFTFVYGLYSRHGRFYPPYDSIPDINYGELIQNLY